MSAVSKRPGRYWLTYLYTGPWDILMWLVVLFVRLAWGRKLHWQDGLWCELKENSWPARTWFRKWAGVTLGHAGFYNYQVSGGPGIDTRCEIHEHTHVEQYEAAMLGGLFISVIILVVLLLMGQVPCWPLHLGIWLLSSKVSYGASVAQAWIRGEDGYRGSHLEEAARAVTTLKSQGEEP